MKIKKKHNTTSENPHTDSKSSHTLTIGSYNLKTKICIPDLVKAGRLQANKY